MSTGPHPANSDSSFCETAEVRVASRWPWPQSDYKLAYVLVSSRIYWKVANEDGSNKPQSFIDFRNENSLELVRLDDEKTWNDVDNDVKVDDERRITVSGRLHGRSQRNNGLLVRNVQLEIKHTAPEQVRVWEKEIRARIVPWNLLEQEIKDAAWGARSSGLKELEQVLGALVGSGGGTQPSSMSTGEAEGMWSKLPENMEKLSIVDKLTTHTAGAVGSGAAFVTLVARAQSVADTAKLIGDLSKFVTGVSSIFHLVSLGAQGISMCEEAKRGQKVLPIALHRMSIILEYVLNSITEVMMPLRGVHDISVEFVLDALKQTVCTMDKAETQLLRGRGNQILNAEDVKEVENQLGRLRHMAVTAGNTSWICTVNEKLCQLEKQLKMCENGVHHVKPSLSAFFSGRKQELSKLEKILEKWGSAVITQYGGVGKTELMIAFADRAERKEVVPGGIFWVTVDGGEKDVIESLARLAEKLTSRTMDEEERRNGNLVVAALKQGLVLREGRWLLCLDNADDSKVSGILNEVCGMTVGAQGNGWVVVTSRQGQPHVWSRMKSEQKLILEPLCEKDAMVALCRQIEKIETSERDDDAVWEDIKKLKEADAAEHRALKELCGDDGACSLGGLPLALVQAGTYIARFKCSFAEYLQKFKNANRKEDMQHIMRSTEDVKQIRDSQRSIWTTWKISVEQLSEQAYTVLRAMAMLAPGGVGEAMVKRIIQGITTDESGNVDWMFLQVVIEELVHGSSLIFRNEESQAGGLYLYDMHRLVRRFIVSDMEQGSRVWNHVYSLALVCVHEAVETKLEMAGKSFERLPAVFDNNHRAIAAHAVALVHRHVIPMRDAEIRDFSQVEDIHQYSGQAMKFLGKLEEEVHVWERLVDVLEHQEVVDRSGMCNQRSKGERIHGKSRIACAYNSLANALMRNGNLNLATSTLEKSLEMKLEIYGPDKPHPEIATSFNNLGLLYQTMGNLNKALEHCEKSLEMGLEIYGPNEPHPDVAMSLNNLGWLYETMGNLDKALEYHQKSLEMGLEIYGPNKPHPDVARSFNSLGHLYKTMGNLDKALDHHEKCLKMRLEIYGPNKPHPDVVTSLNNLGWLYEAMGNLNKALNHYKKCLEMRLEIYGPDKPHPEVATSFHNLGLLYQTMGNLNKALEYHQKSLEMGLEIYGPNEPHPDVATSLNNMGLLHQTMGNLDEALKHYKMCLEMGLEIYGRDKPHPEVATSLNNLGWLYETMGNLDKALEQYEKSLEIRLEIYGHDKPHPDVARSFNSLGHLYKTMGNLNKALEHYEKSLEMGLEIYGPDKPHPDVATSLNNLGWLYKTMGNLDKALEYHKKCLEMGLEIYGPNKPHPDVATYLYNLGRLFKTMGNLDKALEYHQKSLEMRLGIYGPNKPHSDVARSFNSLGHLYKTMGNLNKALEHHEKCLKMRLEIYAPDVPYGPDKPHPDVVTSLNNLGQLCKTMGNLGKALEYHEKCLEMRLKIYGPNKPCADIARSLLSIGIVHHEQKNLDLAAEVLQQSLEMFRTVHGENSRHPQIAKVLSRLSDLDKVRGRKNEASAIRERNTVTDKGSDDVPSNRASRN